MVVKNNNGTAKYLFGYCNLSDEQKSDILWINPKQNV